jgi:cell division protein FtsQ
MARAEQQPSSSLGWLRVGRAFVLPLLSVTAIGLLALGVFWTSEEYLIENPRFKFQLAQLAGDATTLRVGGQNRANAADIRDLFLDDHGASVYLVPIEERRAQILQLNWVKDATVVRRWPNEIDVFVVERQPIAFVQLSRRRGGSPDVAFIDEEGVILAIPDRQEYDLPVLLGVRADQRSEDRAARVRVMKRFFDEIEKLPVNVAEVDLADPENLKCRIQVNDRSVVLLLGQENFGVNVRRFLQHWQDIQRRMPEASVLDLRIPDRITAAPTERRSG